MNTLLKDKKIVIMGVVNKASIAWGCAKAMNDCGATVIYTYQNDRVKKQLEKLVGTEANLVECDVATDEQVEEAFNQIHKTYGTMDGLVHSIAFARKEELGGNVFDSTREGFAIAHDISSYSLLLVSRYASKIMNPGGSIITMTYIGSERAIANYNIMGLAKASLEAAVRYLALDLAKQDIRVNAISSGAIKTLAASGIKGFNALLDEQAARTPSGKQVTTEEVGNTAAFLMSDMSRGIVGEIIYVDKGTHMT